MLQNLLDTILPADSELGMPAASSIDFAAYQKKMGIEPLVQAFVEGCTEFAKEKYGKTFAELSEEESLAVIHTLRGKKIDIFSEFIRHLFRAYYTDHEVLSKIPAGSVPPYPEGNPLEPSDWSLLEPVKARGTIYRKVS